MSGQVDLSVAKIGDVCRRQDGQFVSFDGCYTWHGPYMAGGHEYMRSGRYAMGSHREWNIVGVYRDIADEPPVEPEPGSILKEKETEPDVWPDHLVFLDQAGRGCISGRVADWPQLKPACKWAAEEIRRHIAARSPSPPECVERLNRELAVWKKAMVEAGPHFGAVLTGDNSMEFVAAIPEQARLFAARMNRQIADVTAERDSLQADLDAIRAVLDEKHRVHPQNPIATPDTVEQPVSVISEADSGVGSSDAPAVAIITGPDCRIKHLTQLLSEATVFIETPNPELGSDEWVWLIQASAAIHNQCVKCSAPCDVEGDCVNPECCFGRSKLAQVDAA